MMHLCQGVLPEICYNSKDMLEFKCKNYPASLVVDSFIAYISVNSRYRPI